MTTRRLWLLVLVAAVLQGAVPALRELVPVWWRCHRPEDSLSEGRHETAPTPEQFAAMTGVPKSSQAAWDQSERDLVQSVSHEYLLIRRAIETTSWDREQHDYRLAAAQAACAGAPDNAVGWYLLAACRQRSGDLDGALAALARGNRAARLEDFEPDRVEGQVRALQAAGSSEFDSWVHAQPVRPFPAFAAYRELARTLCPRDAGPQARLEVLAFGARLSSEGRSFIGAMVGRVPQMLAFTGSTKVAQRGSLEAGAAQLAAERRSQGRADTAAWVSECALRYRALGRALPGVVDRGVHATDHVAHVSAAAMAVLILLWSALVALGCTALPVGRCAAPDDGRVPLIAVLVPAAVAGVVAVVCLAAAHRADPFDFGLVDYWHGLLPIIALPPVAAAVWGIAVRRPTRHMLLPAAALLLLLAWCAQGPVVRERAAVVRGLRTQLYGEAKPLHRAMDAAAPYRLIGVAVGRQ